MHGSGGCFQDSRTGPKVECSLRLCICVSMNLDLGVCIELGKVGFCIELYPEVTMLYFWLNYGRIAAVPGPVQELNTRLTLGGAGQPLRWTWGTCSTLVTHERPTLHIRAGATWQTQGGVMSPRMSLVIRKDTTIDQVVATLKGTCPPPHPQVAESPSKGRF